jgi:hypothetical protein
MPLLSILLIAALMFTACPMDGGVDGEGSDDTVVTVFSLDGKVTAPVRGAAPDTTAINEAQYTGAVAWQTEGGTAQTGAFAASTVYKAVVTLTAKTGYTFTGAASDTFTYTGAASVTNAANSGTVTITFPATAAEGADTVVNAFSLDGKVTAPVRGATPNTTAINETQYTGAIAWQTTTGAAHSGAFAASTVYKAVVTLTAKSGYIFTGVGANSFTYSGATVTNAANSGTVTITFPATAAADGPAAAVVTAFSLDGKVTAPVRDATPDTTAINEAQYTGTIAWQTEDGAAHSGAFAASTVYRAVVTLAPKTGYTFTGVGANRFTYTGATQVTNAANSGTVTITFPKTADTVVTAFSLDSLVTAPVRDETPDTTAIDEAQYTGSIAWQTENGAGHSSAFAASTVYKAVVTLSAKSGWTFTGVASGAFTYTGAAVTNAANSGTVTITFPATEAPGALTDISVSFTGPAGNDITLDGGFKLSKSNTAYSSITISVGEGGAYDAFRWLVDGTGNGADVAGKTGGSVTLNASNYSAGTHWLTVIAKKDGVSYSGEFLFAVRK